MATVTGISLIVKMISLTMFISDLLDSHNVDMPEQNIFHLSYSLELLLLTFVAI